MGKYLPILDKLGLSVKLETTVRYMLGQVSCMDQLFSGMFSALFHNFARSSACELWLREALLTGIRVCLKLRSYNEVVMVKWAGIKADYGTRLAAALSAISALISRLFKTITL